MSQRESIIEVVKEFSRSTTVPLDELAVGFRAAMVIYNLRKETDTLDIFLTEKQYNRFIEAGNAEASDDGGKYIPYFDFTRLRCMTRKQKADVVDSYEIRTIHPEHLREMYVERSKHPERPARMATKDVCCISEISSFLRRYW